MSSRRTFLQLSALTCASLLLGCNDSTKASSNTNIIDTTALSQKPSEGLFDFTVEGTIPNDLEGSLYRNGPSLFERASVKKVHILDGDGFITKLHLKGADTTFQGKFVTTSKYLEENQASEFLYDSWDFSEGTKGLSIIDSTNNSNQSSVSVKSINGKILSFDETPQPYEIDSETLEANLYANLTNTPTTLKDIPFHAAHAKTDPNNGDFINFGIQYGDPTAQEPVDRLKSKLHVYVVNQADESIKFYKIIDLSNIFPNQQIGGVYIHDFFFTENHIVFNFQPVFSDLRYIGGVNTLFNFEEKSLADTYAWIPAYKNQIVVVNRVNPNSEIININSAVTKAWWHSSNAYEVPQEDGSLEIVLDYLGYDKFNFFNQEEAMLAKIIEGSVDFNHIENHKPLPLRDVIKVSQRNQQGAFTQGDFVSHTIMNQSYYTEFPSINENFLGRKNNFFYSTLFSDKTIFNGIGRFNHETETWDQKYLYPEHYVCGEPLFCPKTSAVEEDDGYLISTIHNLQEKYSAVAIFDSKTISSGPVATLKLKDSLPLRLHGTFVQQS